MEPRQAMYDFVTGLVTILTSSGGLWLIIGPFLLMIAVIRFVRWAFNRARGGPDYEALNEGYSQTTGELRRAGARLNENSSRLGRRFRW